MRKAELIAREKRAEREARIKENAKEEERKLEKQRARLEQNKRQSEMREKELAINLDKKLSEAEKTRKIKKLRECKSISASFAACMSHVKQRANSFVGIDTVILMRVSKMSSRNPESVKWYIFFRWSST